MAVVGEDVVFRQRVSELVRIGEARESPQVLGVGPERVMTEAALIAAGIDESSVIDLGHAELLWLTSASSAQAVRGSEIICGSGNDNGTHSAASVVQCRPLNDR